MSDTMFYGVLRMPYEMAMEGDISRLQFYDRVQECANRCESAEAEVARLTQALADKDLQVMEAQELLQKAVRDVSDLYERQRQDGNEIARLGELAQAANRQAEDCKFRMLIEENKRRHWQCNHRDVVARLKIATERPDLPVDRIPAIKELERLQAIAAAPQQHAQAAQGWGYAMVHKTGENRGFSWKADDPLFSADWQRVALAPALGNAQAALSNEHRAAIEAAAQCFESAVAHNDGKGRTVLAHDQKVLADGLRAILATRQPAPKSLPSIPTDAMCRAAREKIGIGSNIAGHAWRIMASEFSGSVAPVAAAVQGDCTIAGRQPSVVDPDCNYLMIAGRICNKCGRVHRGIQFQRAASKDSERDAVKTLLSPNLGFMGASIDHRPSGSGWSFPYRARIISNKFRVERYGNSTEEVAEAALSEMQAIQKAAQPK